MEKQKVKKDNDMPTFYSTVMFMTIVIVYFMSL